MTRTCRCRSCGWTKGSSRDICCNPECSKPKVVSMLRPKGRPITVNVKHGFHAELVRSA